MPYWAEGARIASSCGQCVGLRIWDVANLSKATRQATTTLRSDYRPPLPFPSSLSSSNFLLFQVEDLLLPLKQISGGDASGLSASHRYLENATVIDDAFQALRTLPMLIRKILS